MRRMWTGLLVVVALAFWASPCVQAQVGPTVTGETGLFTLPNAQMLPAGQFSFSLGYNHQALTAAPSLVTATGPDDPLLYWTGRLGMTLAYGLTSQWEASLAFGQRYYRAEDKLWSGSINGFERVGAIRHNETDKVRLGTKLLLNPRTDEVKLVLMGGMWIPTQSKYDAAALSTHRTDFDFGFTANYRILTVGASLLVPGGRGEVFILPSQATYAVGVNVPVVPGIFSGIGELNRVMYSGGDAKPEDYTELTLGGRLALGKSGFSTSLAARANLTRWQKYGTSPMPFGGLLQVAYQPVTAAPPMAPPAQVVATQPEPSPAPVMPAPAAEGETPRPAPPAPIAAPAAPKGETSTTDEVLFDSAKSRLTNIAKAILDGVALRLKNNFSATCTITGYTDPKEKGGDHGSLGRSRAEAAKDYLVKRHGLDGSRIAVEARGDASAGDAATRNRKAIVTVTFP